MFNQYYNAPLKTEEPIIHGLPIDLNLSALKRRTACAFFRADVSYTTRKCVFPSRCFIHYRQVCFSTELSIYYTKKSQKYQGCKLLKSYYISLRHYFYNHCERISANLCNIAAVCARVAPAFGSMMTCPSSFSPTPLIMPSLFNICIASIA